MISRSEVLPPVAPDEPPKGIAEVVVIPVVPALLNAIFDATGRSLSPFAGDRPNDMLKGALLVSNAGYFD